MDADDIRKMFAAFSRVTVRRMFGGAGIFADSHPLGRAHLAVMAFRLHDPRRLQQKGRHFAC